jgi:hypothetical protein
LLSVVANLICIFSVSLQQVLLSTLPKVFIFFFGQNGCTRLFFWKIYSRLMSIIFPFLPRVQLSFPYKRWGGTVYYELLFLKISGTNLVQKYCLKFPICEKNLLVFKYTFHSYRKFHNRDI